MSDTTPSPRPPVNFVPIPDVEELGEPAPELIVEDAPEPEEPPPPTLYERTRDEFRTTVDQARDGHLGIEGVRARRAARAAQLNEPAAVASRMVDVKPPVPGAVPVSAEPGGGS